VAVLEGGGPPSERAAAPLTGLTASSPESPAGRAYDATVAVCYRHSARTRKRVTSDAYLERFRARCF